MTELIRLGGFDSSGETFLYDDRIFRGIYPGREAQCREVLSACRRYNLFNKGVVRTWEAGRHEPFEMTLEHEKVPFITYPHEWSTLALRDAALFHVDFYRNLLKHGLTVKDWHPWNILFEGAESVFVDFTSIIPQADLKQVEYLTPPVVPRPFKRYWDIDAAYLYEMYRRMYVPYFLLPLYMMSQGHFREARRRMLETTLNASNSVISPKEVFCHGGQLQYDYREWRKRFALTERGPAKARFFKAVQTELESLDVAVMSSDYSGYYAAKHEDYPFSPGWQWNDKQKGVYDALITWRLKTVLDVAGNTGWYSILAAKQGYQVVSLDVDEACANRLYRLAKLNRVSVVSLVADINNLTPDVFPNAEPGRSERLQIKGTYPLLLNAERRLKSDLVMALGIVHHLALGQGRTFGQIVGQLSALSKKYLIVELVPKEDNLVASEPDFFPALKAAPHGFEWYTLEGLRVELRKHYGIVTVKDSFPAGRKLLLCEGRKDK